MPLTTVMRSVLESRNPAWVIASRPAPSGNQIADQPSSSSSCTDSRITLAGWNSKSNVQIPKRPRSIPSIALMSAR